MKHSSFQYNEYINNLKKKNYHPYLSDLYSDIEFNNLPNTLFYGSNDIGKYTQCLNIIKNYSKSTLNYSKKAIVPLSNKEDFIIKISDIHYEIDMNTLGCNSRSLWNDIYNHIINIVISTTHKNGIILCKNFECINPELLEIFYCYVNEFHRDINLKFFIITSNISCLMPSLLNNLEIVSFKVPKIQKKTYSIKPINELYDLINSDMNTLDFFDLREKLYNLLLYQIDVYETFYTIIKQLFKDGLIDNDSLFDINQNLVQFSKLYNNNYRPIFHLERFSLYLIKTVNEL